MKDVRFLDNDFNSKMIKKILIIICLVVISLLPGTIVSIVLFVNATQYDSVIQHSRAVLPDTDLSHINLSGYALGDIVVNWNVENNLSFIYCEDGDYFGVGVDDLSGRSSSSPINAIISIYGVSALAINGTHAADVDYAKKLLGNNYLTVSKDTRTWYSYDVYIDRTNDIELRFSFYGEHREVSITRVGVLEKYDINGPARSYASQDVIHHYAIFHDLLFPNVIGRIKKIFLLNMFLPFSSDYFYLPIYGAFWIFPLAFFLYKRRIRWIIFPAVWYPVWCGFGFLTLLMHQ